jgi:hypothetical protein
MARNFSIQLFNFDELTPEAQENAISNYREKLEEGEYGTSDFGRWAIDDCALFEPKHKEMVSLFGEAYNPDPHFVLKNNREGITFNCEAPYRHLSFGKALEVTNVEMFLVYLGIPVEYHKDLQWWFFDQNGRYPDTHIGFEISENLDKIGGRKEKDLESYFEAASTKFSELREEILERIKSSIEYQFSDESIREELERNDSIEFTEEGEIWKD